MRKPHFRIQKFKLPPKQTGAALLLFILLLVVGASTLLVSKLNKATAQYYRDDRTMTSLMRAKEALIGYAVSYPDIVGGTNLGPGHLPCPDTGNDGILQPSCVIATGTSLRRLPWQSLGLGDLRDSSGERLWYVVSNTFRSGPAPVVPMYSETTLPLSGDLTLDGNNTEIVAIIIAPGTSLTGQDRTLDPEDASNYIEVDGPVRNDGVFVSQGVVGNFNDIVMPITRSELMRAVEKRVLGDVDQTLTTYQRIFGNLPWMSTFSDPTTSSYDNNLGTMSGHLPIHFPDEVFATHFTVTWNISGATVNAVPPFIFDTDLESGTQVNVLGTCRWKEGAGLGNNTFQCQGVAIDPGTGWTYTFDFGLTDDISYTGTYVVPAAPPIGFPLPPVRTRAVNIDNGTGGSTSLPVQPLTSPVITINDGVNTGQLILDNPSNGTIQISGLTYELNLNDGQNELPLWFRNNNWHHLVNVAFSPGDTPDSIAACVPGVDCLQLNQNGVQVQNNIQALAVIAGMDITAGPNRPSGLGSDYFEGNNLSPLPPHQTFERSAYPPVWNVFNDQVRIMTP